MPIKYVSHLPGDAPGPTCEQHIGREALLARPEAHFCLSRCPCVTVYVCQRAEVADECVFPVKHTLASLFAVFLFGPGRDNPEGLIVLSIVCE